MKTNQQQRRKIDADERGNALMTVRTIKYYCSKDQLFETPELNQKLYLHFKGFRKIQNLHHYPNLVTIWLNNNSISKIEGLNGLNNLICLYLNNNVIQKIENLQGLEKLAILHLAHNRIEKIEGLKSLKALTTINFSQNFLASPQSIAGLKQSTSLTSIDLSKNDIQCSDALFNIVSSLQNISCLIMKNTPLTKSYKNYRKKLTAALPKLQYLDDRPVKEVDHRLAVAWVKGGTEMENQERVKIAAQIELKNKRESKQLSQKVMREKKKEQQLRILQQSKKKLQQQPQNEENIELISDINYRIQVLKQGPKGFQASITETSIKILHVDQADQQKIIDRYFYNEKMKIQQNLKKIKREADPSLSVKQISIGEDQKIIEKKVRKWTGLNNQKQLLMENNCLTHWHSKYEAILEALLEKDKYNFEVVLPQFNRIVADINKKMMRSFTKWSQRQLQHIWTHIYTARLNHLQQQHNKQQQNK